jgi:hypothetical protein
MVLPAILKAIAPVRATRNIKSSCPASVAKSKEHCTVSGVEVFPEQAATSTFKSM